MTDTQVQDNAGLDADTLEASFAAIAPQEELLVQRFYEELFDRYPAIKPLFAKTDMNSQQSKLLETLKLFIANVRNTDALVPALQEMGRRHESYGAQPEHYPVVASIFLTVMAEIAGDQWTEQMKKAWSDALSVIAEAMVGAYTGAGAASDSPPASPDGEERRSPERPWTAPEVTADEPDESEVDPQPPNASQR